MEKRVALVTGGTRGIGADISLALAGKGYVVAAVYRTNSEQAKKFEKQLHAVSRESFVLQADVSFASGVETAVNSTVQKFNRIDVLVNNAGIFGFEFLEDLDEAGLDHILRVNFKSQFLMTKACVRYMKEKGFGRILNASSISSILADVGLIGYGASKAAVDMMTKISAAELAPYGITVNAYAPGIIHTDMTDAMIKERGHEQVKQIPLNRFGTGAEVASLICYLVSEEAGYISGEIIGINGGMLKVQNPYRAHEYVEGRREKKT